MKILFLTTALPARRSTGGEIAKQAVVEALAGEGHAVTVMGYRRPEDPYERRDDVVCAGVRPIETDSASTLRKAAWMSSAVVRSLPYSAAKYHSPSYARRVSELAHGRYDLAVVDHAQMGWIISTLQQLKLAYVALLHNVEHPMYAERAGDGRGAVRMVYAREARWVRALEERVARGALCRWTLTDDDAEYFAAFGETRILRVPSLLPPRGDTVPKSRDVGLIGSWTWELTRRGLRWFLEQVAPRLPSALSVEVAGRGGDGISMGRVRYRGFVDDAGD